MDEPLRTFKIVATLPQLKNVKHEETIQCRDEEEAWQLARDAAWELYFQNEDTEPLPSYENLFNRYRAESYFMSEREFDMYIDDAYMRYITKNIDFNVEEVK